MNWAKRWECRGTFGGPPPHPDWNHVCSLYFSPFSSGCICLLSPLLLFLWMVWSCFCSPKPFADWPLQCKFSWKQTAFLILSMDPVGLCCTDSDFIGRRLWWKLDQCRTNIVLWWSWILSSCEQCVLFSGDTSVCQRSVKFLLIKTWIEILRWAGLQWLWVRFPLIDWGKIMAERMDVWVRLELGWNNVHVSNLMWVWCKISWSLN